MLYPNLRNLAFGLTGLIIMVIALAPLSCQSEPTGGSKKIPAYRRQQIKMAMHSVEMALASLSDAGYVIWTPTTAAPELVTMLNSSQELTAEEKAEFKQEGMRIPNTDLSYALNQPQTPWQIVLQPDEANQVLIIQAYGNDLETPIATQKIPCCH